MATPPRRKNATDKLSPRLSHAILEAAARHGYDKNGKDELAGYCRFLAEKHPTSFATLLGKVLPMQIAGSSDGPVQHEFTVKFIKSNGNSIS